MGFPLLRDKNGAPPDWLQRPLDFYGIHFDFTFPSSPLNAVIGGQFYLALVTESRMGLVWVCPYRGTFLHEQTTR